MRKYNLPKETKKSCLKTVERYFTGENTGTYHRQISHHITNALDIALKDCVDPHKTNLKNAIIDSCIKAKKFNFHNQNLPMAKSTFYNKRNRFLYEVVLSTEIIATHKMEGK
ncbi:MAG: hypothetical protein FWG63_05115 [Defluviitaleaceae bacterium]|nr:hypothetical protein [Defluviitaleaceae bacterium]